MTETVTTNKVVNMELTVETASIISTYEYGLGTDNPFTSDMWDNGGLSNKGFWYADYGCSPASFQHIFSGDFSVSVYMSINCYEGSGNFGFKPLDESQWVVFSNDEGLLSNYEGDDVTQFTELVFERVGTTYTVYHNGTVYATSTGSNGDVLFYMEKYGSCSIFTGKIVLNEEFNGTQ